MNALVSLAVLSLAVALPVSAAPTAAPGPAVEAPTGFDNSSNGVVDEPTHQADLAKFDEVEQMPSVARVAQDRRGPAFLREREAYIAGAFERGLMLRVSA